MVVVEIGYSSVNDKPFQVFIEKQRPAHRQNYAGSTDLLQKSAHKEFE